MLLLTDVNDGLISNDSLFKTRQGEEIYWSQSYFLESLRNKLSGHFIFFENSACLFFQNLNFSEELNSINSFTVNNAFLIHFTNVFKCNLV